MTQDSITTNANMRKRSQTAAPDDGHPDRPSQSSTKATDSVQLDQAHQHLEEKRYGTDPQSRSKPVFWPEAAAEAAARFGDREEDYSASALDADRISSSSDIDSQGPVLFGSSSPFDTTSSSTPLHPTQRPTTPDTPITTHETRSTSLPTQPCLLRSPNSTASVYIPLGMLRRIDRRRVEDENVNYGEVRRT